MERIAYLSLGSNLGDRENLLVRAIDLIDERCGSVNSTGKIYETPPLGFDSDSFFLNTCIKISTNLSAKELLNEIQQIELELGRQNKSEGRYESRLIDIDIILLDHLILQENSLEIPHPRFRDRLFVLQPLNDIDGGIIDPVSQKTVSELLNCCLDESRISIYKNALSGNE